MQSETRYDSKLFSELMRSLLRDGIAVRFRAQGQSMYPAISDGDTVQVDALDSVGMGNVILADGAEGLRVHRVIRSGDTISTRGDCCFEVESNVSVFGAVSVVRGDQVNGVPRQSLGTVIRRWIARWRGHF